MARDCKFEVGQVWRTRGGWCARIVAIMDALTPVVAVHKTELDDQAEVAEVHDINGGFLKGTQSGWDLVSLEKEAS